MSINKFSNNTPDKPFHSHTFAEAASGSSMGSTSAQSFSQRHQINQNRQVVRRYSDSSVASAGEHLKEELIKRIESPPDTKHNRHKHHPTRQGFNAGETAGAGGTAGKLSARPMQIPKRNFSEPPTRRYNPFS
jgi:hypothetical protein